MNFDGIGIHVPSGLVALAVLPHLRREMWILGDLEEELDVMFLRLSDVAHGDRLIWIYASRQQKQPKIIKILFVDVLVPVGLIPYRRLLYLV